MRLRRNKIRAYFSVPANIYSEVTLMYSKTTGYGKSRIIIRFFAVVLILSLIIQPAAVFGQGEAGGQSMSAFIDGGALYRYNPAGGIPADKDKIEDGADISVEDVLMLKYDFRITADEVEKLGITESGMKYIIKCPEGLQWKTDGQRETPIYLKSGDGEDKQYATMVVTDAHNAYIEFAENIADIAPDGIDDGYFYLTCGLDGSALGIPGGDINKEITLTTGVTLKINVEENKSKPSALTEKTGEYANGRFIWTVKYTPGNKEEKLPLIFSDTFDNKYHDYTEGSFKVKKGEEIKSAEVQSTESNGERTISYKIPQDVSEPLVFSYETALTNDGFAALSKTEVTNTARLLNADNEQVGKTVTAESAFDPVN